VIEEFDPVYDDFFAEPSYQKRWTRLLEIHKESYRSFRVLFVVETLAMMDRWAEPSPELLNRLWAHKKIGGVLGIRFENLELLFLPLWTLDAAKAEVQLYKIAVSNNFQKRYPLGTLRRYSSALVHAWWALETLMNEFASIVLDQRGGTVQAETRALLKEVRVKLDKAGNPVEEPYYQAVSERIQFIFKFLTGSSLERDGPEWRQLMELKNARDGYVHRLGRPGGMGGKFGDDSVVFNGMAAVRVVIARVIRETPEFAARFVYTYLAFWCCGTEAPFVWDGNEGERFFIGLAEPTSSTLVDLLAPVPGNL
jgi:hypothetical protein